MTALRPATAPGAISFPASDNLLVWHALLHHPPWRRVVKRARGHSGTHRRTPTRERLRTPHCASLSQRPTRLALCSCWACRVKTNLAPFSQHHGNLEHAHKSHKGKKKKKKKQWRAQSSELGRERRRKTEKDKGSVMKEERCCWSIGCERHLFCGSLVCFWSCSSGLDEGRTLPGISR